MYLLTPRLTRDDGCVSLWVGTGAPYGFFELQFSLTAMKVRFVTFDDAWRFGQGEGDTVQGGGQVDHCWVIPAVGGGRGSACTEEF